MNKVLSHYNNWIEKFVLVGVFSYPLALLLVKDVGTLIFGLLALLSLIQLKDLSSEIKFEQDEKILFYASLLIVFIALFVSVIGGLDSDAWESASHFISFLLAAPLYLLLKKHLKKTDVIWWGMLITVLVCSVLSIYESNFGLLFRDGGSDRAQLAVHPIHFANLILSMTVMLLAAMLSIKNWNYKVVSAFVLILVLGLVAVVLSKSRGAWVVVPVLLIIFGFQFKKRIHIKAFSVVSFLVIFLFSGLYMVPSTGVKQRVDGTIKNIQSYSEGTRKSTSIGTRFEMWKASWLIFKENPIVGVGWGNYVEATSQLVEKKVVNRSAIAESHPHSEYFSAIANGGILMFTAVLIVFLAPLYFFKQLFSLDDREIKSYAFAGIVLIISYMGFSLSASMLERSIPATFYVFYVTALLALANKKKQNLGY